MPDPYDRWCAANGTPHGHCPEGCEHPQPFGVVLSGETRERVICGRCWHCDGAVTEIVPCTDEVC